MIRLKHLIFLLTYGVWTTICQEINEMNDDYGVFIGEFTSPSMQGKVYVVNETTIQILNFTYSGDNRETYFWLDDEQQPTEKGIKIPTREFGPAPIGQYENQHVILNLPGFHKIHKFKSLSLYSRKQFALVVIPISPDLLPPKSHFLSEELTGTRYNIASGPIQIIDRKTIKVFAFRFEGNKAPDGVFIVGNGSTVELSKAHKVPIRGKDTKDNVESMTERYDGSRDIILDLPEGVDVYSIDWLSVYCIKFRVNYGNVWIKDVPPTIPPYVTPFKPLDLSVHGQWEESVIVGDDAHINFTFQIGVPGGPKGYSALRNLYPSDYVWYVNGYMSPDIYLRRGITYNFIVEGGRDKSQPTFNNALYLSEDAYGGFERLTDEEKAHIRIASVPRMGVAGRLCSWSRDDDSVNADLFKDFLEFRNQLKLNCEDSSEETEILTFMPTANTSNTLYYQSMNNFNMGGVIHIVDDLPTDVTSSPSIPYKYDDWLQSASSFHSYTSFATQKLNLFHFFYASLILLVFRFL